MAYSNTTLLGNLTRDPELRSTQSGKMVCSFTVAVKRRFQNVTDFHNCVAWGNEAELISKHFSKGKEILVSGELQNRSYEDGAGNKRQVTELKVDTFSFTGRKDSDENARASAGAVFGNFEVIEDDEEIPF